jgi:hypothetical protein
MRTSFRFILALVMTSFLLIACVTQPRASLTPSEATRLADIKARATGHNLRDYERALATYDGSDESWWTSYVPKGGNYVEFNIRVDNKTREAWLVLR